MEHKKMMKTATVMDKILRALQIILAAAEGLFVFAVICMIIFRDAIAAHSEYITDSISCGDLILSTAHGAALANPSLLIKSQLVTGVLFAILIVIAWYGICIFRQILKPIKNGEPFYAGTSDNLRKLAVFVIVAGIVNQVFTSIASGMMYKAYDFSRLLNTQIIEKYTLNHTLDLNFLFVAVILFLLAYVFRYGEGLQKESDETL